MLGFIRKKMEPFRAHAWNNLGTVGGGVVNGQQYGKAECYIQALKLNPKHAEAKNKLAGAEARAEAEIAKAKQLFEGANIVLSVRYDTKGMSPFAQILSAYLRTKYNLHVYNPNFFTKKDCGQECALTGYQCAKVPYTPPTRPTDADCWQTSYRWHLQYPDLWGKPNKTVIMLAVKEDGALGQGQETEQRMAAVLGVTRLEINMPKVEDLDELPEAVKKLKAEVDAALRATFVI